MKAKSKRHNPIILIIILTVILTAAMCCCRFDLLRSADDASGAAESIEGSSERHSAADEAADILTDIPEYRGYAFCYVNGNDPDFEEDEIWTSTQEALEPLDELGRCGTASSCIGKESMPTEPRGDISSVEPTGWRRDTYEFVEGELLFNRCHLIGHQLSGDNAIPRNLITGTSYMNRDGMLQFENAIASYVRDTGNHVMYRVTPVFVGDELICRGVHMQAVSVEDGGSGLAFNVFCYNVQPGVDIDYKTGDNRLSEDTSLLEDYQAGRYTVMANTHGEIPDGSLAGGESRAPEKTAEESADEQSSPVRTYILNTNTGKFHYPDCKSVSDMSGRNRQETEASREDLIARGFEPCGNCRP